MTLAILSQCPGGQCRAAAQASAVTYAPPVFVYQVPPAATIVSPSMRTYYRWPRHGRPVINGYTVCTPAGCYRR